MKRLAMFFIGGVVFGIGLAVSGMTRPEVVLSFLTFDDLGLLLVMGTALAVALPVFQLFSKPFFGGDPEPFSAALNLRTVSGSVLFGVGWGVSGVCPGAAIASVGTGNWPVLVAVAAMFVGAFVQGKLMDRGSAATESTTSDPSGDPSYPRNAVRGGAPG